MSSRFISQFSIAAVAAFGVLINCSHAKAAPLVSVKADVLSSHYTRMSADAAVVAPNAPLTLVLQLKGNDAALNTFLTELNDPNSSNYHKWVTPTQFGEMFGASQSDVADVVNWANVNGLTVSKVWENNRFITINTNVGTAEAALHVQLHSYMSTDKGANSILGSDVVYAPNSLPALPDSIAGKVIYVAGLSNAIHRTNFLIHLQNPIPQAIPAAEARPDAVAPLTNPLVPADLNKIYDFGALQTAAASNPTQSIGIYSPTLFDINDVHGFETQFGITAPDPIEKWPAASGRIQDFGGADEACLDIETIMGQAHKSQIVLYEGDDSTVSALLDEYNQMASDNLPVISSSWGFFEAENTWLSAGEAIAAQSAAQGQTLLNASGDSGPFGDPNNPSLAAVTWPASGDSTTAVGGTTLPDSNNGAWNSEVAWADFSGTTFLGGSGGGLSSIFPRASWQTGPGVNNVNSNGMRQVPDVAALGGGPGYLIFFGGSLIPVEGTSGACPLWASAMILTDEGLNTRLGLINPTLYKIGARPTDYASAFHDITSGHNPLFSTTPNWDYITGLGSADFSNFYNVFAGTIVPPNPGPKISPISGNYPGAVTVTMTPSKTGWTILYTTDRSDPATSSTAITYSAPFKLHSDAIITAVAELTGQPNSEETTASYTFSFVHSFTAGLQMISMPFGYQQEDISSIFDVAPKLALWDPTTTTYAISPAAPANTINRGVGYWVRISNVLNVVDAGSGAQITADPFSIPLSAGWNQISDPFTTSVLLSDCSVTTSSNDSLDYVEAVTTPVIGVNLFNYDPTQLQYVAVTPYDSIQPFTGYWIYAYAPCTLVVPAPASGVTPG